MLRVLVTVASRHGATDGIARAIAAAVRRTFESSGVEAEVDCTSLVEVRSVETYDGVVLGSAVYMGRWLGVARRFVEAHAAELAVRPTWLFSSGPIGSPPEPTDDAVDVAHLVNVTRARAHETFAGRLQRNDLRLAERMVASALHVPDGDFRDFAAIDEWGTTIACTLVAERTQPRSSARGTFDGTRPSAIE